MVVKLTDVALGGMPLFESRVILDGSQTTHLTCHTIGLFESRVILDGSQTDSAPVPRPSGLRVVLF